MTLDFPTLPEIGQEYRINGITYVWDGRGWQRRAASVVQIQTAPYEKQERTVAP